jgi:hypothetical protein
LLLFWWNCFSEELIWEKSLVKILLLVCCDEVFYLVLFMYRLISDLGLFISGMGLVLELAYQISGKYTKALILHSLNNFIGFCLCC